MKRPLLDLGFVYQFDTEKRTGPDINFQSERHDLRERLGVKTEGWIYHPAFWEYDIDIKPEFNQRREKTPAFEGSKNAFLQGYFLRTTFLPYKPYSLTLFGQKQNVPSLSAFSNTSDTDIEDFGGILSLSYHVLPTSLNYTREKRDQTGFFNSQEITDRWQLRSTHRKGNSNTEFNAIYEEREYTTTTSGSEVDRTEGNIINTYNWEEKDINFTTYLSQRNTDDGSLKTSITQFNENINWQHRENLKTNYRLLFDSNTTGDIFTETKNIGAGLSHRLYENLSTDLSGDIFKRDFTGGNENSLNGNLRFNYIRPIPYGTLGANMNFNYRLRSSTFDEEFIPVIDEPQVLTGIAFSFLNNKFIDIGSIKVTNTNRTRVYINNIDYEIDEINFFVRIRRLIGSGIADGETVLVSYRYLSTTPSYDDSLFSQSYGFNANLWSTLLFFYEYKQSKQKILSGIPPDEPIDDTEHTAELEILWRFTDTILTYKKADRTAGNSVESWRVDEVLTFRPVPRLYTSIRGHLGQSDFKGFDEKQDSYGFGFNVDWLPVIWGKLGLQGSRSIVSGVSENTEDTEFTAVAEMSYSIWNFSVRYLYLFRKDNIINETREINNIIFEIVKVNF